MDNPSRSDKILGTEYNFAYINECLDVAPLIREKIKSRLARKTTGFRNFIISDCNPGNPQHYVYKRFYKQTNEKSEPLPTYLKLYKETFYPDDNKENLANGYIETMLDTMSGNSKERFRHGRWCNVEGAVHKNILDTNIIEVNQDLLYYDDVVVGMDFGYYTAFVIVGFKNEQMYIIHDFKLIDGTTNDIIRALDEWKYLKKFMIYADHEGDRINEISASGYMIKPAYKEVGAGDSSVNGFSIFFDTSCMNTYNTMQNMRRQQDKDGNFIEKHVKEDDHEDDTVPVCLFWLVY